MIYYDILCFWFFETLKIVLEGGGGVPQRRTTPSRRKVTQAGCSCMAEERGYMVEERGYIAEEHGYLAAQLYGESVRLYGRRECSNMMQ